MENQFLIDSEYLSAEALEKKHRLETDPSSKAEDYYMIAVINLDQKNELL